MIIKKPSELPECIIINKLVEKANLKNDYEFNYLYYLDEIRKVVSIEVQRINILFPEYTPHDANYHLRRLFYVADLLLGEKLINSMNVTELFLLCVSLYAHDWGMAVSEDEKDFIISGCNDSNKFFDTLDDEHIKFKEFCKNRKISPKNITFEEWQEYVRITHAFRSGKRIKNFFDSISVGIGEFASRICEGHWLDFDIIDDHLLYPIHAPIHLDIVNIKALTIYVRLVDLLDLGEDRTPYILWKFVAPRNEISKLEWNKHRALLPVTFPNYLNGRYIQVTGGTDDHNVYSGLMDLKNYINQQFRQCSDILSRINHNYHKLDISHINWEIAAKGFEPILIQFEFDRARMFEILSDQIYQGNPYVFIRELVQNAIDAIQMREEIYKRSEMSFKPKIEIIIEEDDNTYIISIKDNGIGMDEYIIKNYLAVAGKSYYRSQDFQKEGLQMDPISKFGIGVLSCFMVSEHIEIKTFRDPQINQKHEYLVIKIPAKENYFRIEKNRGQLDIGSTFIVTVKKSALPIEPESKAPVQLYVTEYLKRTAAFVKYPITIHERNITSSIFNSNDEESLTPTYKVDYRFPFDKAIFPQNIESVKKYFFEKRFDLKTDLNLNNYEGSIIYLLPKSDTLDFISNGRSWPTKSVDLIDYNDESIKDIAIQWNEEWLTYRHKGEDVSLYERNSSYYVYIDGLLIQDIDSPRILLNEDYPNDDSENIDDGFYSSAFVESFVASYIIINLPKPKDLKLDLARTKILSNERWDQPIWNSFAKHLKTQLFHDWDARNPKQKLIFLGRLITFYNLPFNIILEDFINYKLPIPVLTKANIEFREYETLPHNIKILPREYTNDIITSLTNSYISRIPYIGPLDYFNSKDEIALINLEKYIYDYEKYPVSISNFMLLLKAFILKKYYLAEIEFIASPLGKTVPLVVENYKLKGEDNCTIEELLSIDILQYDSIKMSHLNKFLLINFKRFPTITAFPEPYSQSFAYSFRYLNSNHDLTQRIVTLCLTLIQNINTKLKPRDVTGEIFDKISSIPFINNSNDEVSLHELNYKISSLFEDSKRYDIIPSDFSSMCELEYKNFVENSITINHDFNYFEKGYEMLDYADIDAEWGLSLTSPDRAGILP